MNRAPKTSDNAKCNCPGDYARYYVDAEGKTQKDRHNDWCPKSPFYALKQRPDPPVTATNLIPTLPQILYVPDHDAWVADCDVDARHGRGTTRLTKDRSEAKVFPSLLDALEYWKRQSTVQPLRDDGKPNRPLTAYGVNPQPRRRPDPKETHDP